MTACHIVRDTDRLALLFQIIRDVVNLTYTNRKRKPVHSFVIDDLDQVSIPLV